jgi:hypothetical protein
MTPKPKPWTPTPGSYPTDTARCPICHRNGIRIMATQPTQPLCTHRHNGDVATGSGPICSGSGKATR